MKKLSQPTTKLISDYKKWARGQKKEGEISTLHVDEVASKVASIYEKLREIIDWREEHLLRKTAIERMLKRNLFLKKKGGDIARNLIYELIRAGHFPNDTIEESKVDEVQGLIDKYLFILENSPSEKNQKIQLYNWLSAVAACEVEDLLSPRIREKALITFMYKLMKERVTLEEKAITIRGLKEKEKNIQVFIAVQRALFKLDESLITYHLLKKRYPNWNNLDQEKLKNISQNIYSIWEKIEEDLSHPLGDKFYGVCEKYDTPYLLLGDILSENAMNAEKRISNPENLESLTKKHYNKRLSTLKKRLGRAAFYSTLSIFLSNVAVLLAIEIPLVHYVTGQFNFISIGVDILGPTLLMAFLVLTIRPPKKGNLKKVIMEMMKIVYKTERKDTYNIKTYPKRGFIINTVINFFYLISFCASYGLVFYGLYKIKFPPLSYLIFLVFISLIAFAGIKIRERAKELQVTEKKRSILGFFITLISLPVLRIGKWLSIKWRKYNVLAVLFSSLIDMPFMAFVRFLEQWSYFLKEKREEIH